MSSLDANPVTLNQQSPLNYVFRLQRAPSLSYFCQSVKIPETILGVTEVPMPSLRIPFYGDHMRYGALECSFKVDADLQNWLEMFNWMKGLGNPSNDGKILKVLEANPDWSSYGQYSDINLLTTDSYRNPSFQFTFERAFPIALTGPHFESTDQTVQYMTCSVGFRFMDFHVSNA